MVKFKISAPGRLSLFGEHMMKYDKTFLSVAVDLRTTLIYNDEITSPKIQFNFSQIDLCHEIPLQIFRKLYASCIGKDHMELRERVLEFTNDLCQSAEHRTILQIFYYFLVYMTYKEQKEIKSFTMDLASEFMMDDELACPASFIVCLAASFYHLSRLQDHYAYEKSPFENDELKLIHEYATSWKEMSSESDVTTCLYGLITEYQTKEHLLQTRPLVFTSYMPNMMILLVDSKQTQNLEAQTQQIEKLKNTLPGIVNPIIDNIENTTKRAYKTFQRLVTICQDNRSNRSRINDQLLEQYDVLKHLIRINHSLLRALSVSHKDLDDICSIAQKHEMQGKYTDIGNGRYAYVWCLQHHMINESCTHFTPISEELSELGFDVRPVELACNGVRIEINE